MNNNYGKDPYLDGMLIRLGTLTLLKTERPFKKEEQVEFKELQKLIKEYKNV